MDLNSKQNETDNSVVDTKNVVKYNVKNNKVSQLEKDDVSEIISESTQPEDTVGVVLKKKRLELSLDIDTIANALKIKPKYLNAIESDNFSMLPGNTYAIGFIKSYSRYLKLDADLIIENYKKQSTEYCDFEYEDNVQMKPLKKTSSFRNYFVLTALIIFILFSVFFGIRLIVIGISRKRINTVNTMNVDNNSSHVTVNGFDNKPDVLENIMNNNSDINITANNTILNKTTNYYKEDKNHHNKDNLQENKVYGYENKSLTRVMLKATGTSWIKLKQSGVYVYDTEKGDIGSGNTVFEGTLYAGDVYYLPNTNDLYLTVGNARYIDIYVDGSKLNSLSNIDNVSKLNIEVNPEKLIKL